MRDLVLERPVVDLDFAIEGEIAPFAGALAERLDARITVHERFGTAVLALPGGSRLDVAATRAETYARPGALPSVSPAPIEVDLARRDFTVNAMALELAPASGGALLDPFGGLRDLEARVLRLLHPRSPFDDPTRAFRAARYANRLGFSVERGTRAWIRLAVSDRAFDAVSGDRLRREIELIFAEENRAGGVARMQSLGLPATLHPALGSGARILSRLRRAEEIASKARDEGSPRAGWLQYLLVWAAELSPEELEALARRLNLSRRDSKTLRGISPKEHLAFAVAAARGEAP